MGLFNPLQEYFSSTEIASDTLQKSVDVVSTADNAAVVIRTLSINMRALGRFSITATHFPFLVTLRFPSLIEMGNTSSIQNVGGHSLLTTLEMPNFVKWAGTAQFFVRNNPLLASIVWPKYQGVYSASGGNHDFSGNSAMTSLEWPALVKLGAGLNVSNGTALASVLLPFDTITFNVAAVVLNFSGCALPQAEVNRLLILMAANPAITGATFSVNFTGGTNGAPSGDGLTAKTTLTGRGVVVTNN